MKMLIAIVNSNDASTVMNELIKNKYSVTKLQTSGGFLRAGNATFLIGVEDEKVENVMEIIKEFSSKRKVMAPANAAYIGEAMMTAAPIEVTVGGATVFVIDVEQFRKL